VDEIRREARQPVESKLVGLLVDQADPRAEAQVADMNEAARGLDLQIHIVKASNEDEIERAFANISQVGARGLLVGTGEFLRRRAEQVVRLAAQQNLPAIYQYREFAKLGGLSSYGTDLIDSYRQAGVYSGRVLKGEKPGDLPRAASDQIRSRHQSQDRKSAQPDNFARGVGDCRRSDRMRTRLAPSANSLRRKS
jgi:putative ABC transport system substrate-binding protein